MRVPASSEGSPAPPPSLTAVRPWGCTRRAQAKRKTSFDPTDLSTLPVTAFVQSKPQRRRISLTNEATTPRTHKAQQPNGLRTNWSRTKQNEATSSRRFNRRPANRATRIQQPNQASTIREPNKLNPTPSRTAHLSVPFSTSEALSRPLTPSSSSPNALTLASSLSDVSRASSATRLASVASSLASSSSSQASLACGKEESGC